MIIQNEYLWSFAMFSKYPASSDIESKPDEISSSAAATTKYTKLKDFSIEVPWSPQIYLTARGAENMHIYLWILKDLCWTQNFGTPSIVFGSLALVWCGVGYFLMQSLLF